MEWTTVYMTGRPGFCEDVVKNLEKSGLEFMSGYLTRLGNAKYELFWIPESTTLDDFKRAVGARTVFRYRLRFHWTLDEFIERTHNDELTPEEKQKVERMRLTDAA